LIRAAIERDPGFEVPMFVTQLELVHRVLPEQVSQYNVDADQLNGIKNRFDVWAWYAVDTRRRRRRRVGQPVRAAVGEPDLRYPGCPVRGGPGPVADH
jgi:hypothetical protein